MNRYPATLVHISPVHLRQGLFFSLALLLTLIAGQLYQTRQVVQDASGLSARTTPAVTGVPVPASMLLMQSRPAAATAVRVDATTPRDRWVF